MFPGMNMPQALPDQVSYPMFWKNLTRFLIVSGTTAGIALAIRHCESRMDKMLISTI